MTSGNPCGERVYSQNDRIHGHVCGKPAKYLVTPTYSRGPFYRHVCGTHRRVLESQGWELLR